jgi:tRNA 2-thiouridine synthesizing protein D
MSAKSLLLYTTHGTYGRDDDGYGACLAANSALSKGLEVALLLIDDGVALAKHGQNPNIIGLPNNNDEIKDFLELGGRLIVIQESLVERGIKKEELEDEAEIIAFSDIYSLIEYYDLVLTF